MGNKQFFAAIARHTLAALGTRASNYSLRACQALVFVSFLDKQLELVGLKAIVLLDSCFGCVKAPYCAVTTFPQGASSDSIVLLGICMYVTDNRKVGDKSTRRLLETSENLSVF